MTLILNQNDVKTVLHMKDCMAAVEDAFIEMENGSAVLPLRTNIAPPKGISLYMPAYLQRVEALACKVVTVFKENPKRYSLPTIIGKVLLQDPNTGDVICIMDGSYLTAMRTGAASGVATKHMARQQPNQIAGIFGAGVQAEMQLLAVSIARGIKRAIVYDTIVESAKRFCVDVGERLNLTIDRATQPDDVLAADIICTASSSATPVFTGQKVKSGTHINGIGSHTPNARELDSYIIKHSRLVGDSRDACFSEPGDIIIPLEAGEIDENHFYAELGEVVCGKKVGRINDEEITVFKSNGLAIQDAASAKLVFDKAIAAGIGLEVEI